MGDRLGFAQQEQLVLGLSPNCSVFDWVEVVSIHERILSRVMSAIGVLPTRVLACMLKPRRWLLVPHQEFWKSCPIMVPLPFEKLTCLPL